jgi:cold shock CspA family protein
MPKGMVKHTRLDKGYAFLTSDEGPDVFVHVGAAAETGAKLQVGLWYEYDTKPNKRFPNKWEACNLRPIKDRATIEQEKAWASGNPPPVVFGE